MASDLCWTVRNSKVLGRSCATQLPSYLLALLTAGFLTERLVWGKGCWGIVWNQTRRQRILPPAVPLRIYLDHLSSTRPHLLHPLASSCHRGRGRKRNKIRVVYDPHAEPTSCNPKTMKQPSPTCATSVYQQSQSSGVVWLVPSRGCGCDRGTPTTSMDRTPTCDCWWVIMFEYWLVLSTHLKNMSQRVQSSQSKC